MDIRLRRALVTVGCLAVWTLGRSTPLPGLSLRWFLDERTFRHLVEGPLPTHADGLIDRVLGPGISEFLLGASILGGLATIAVFAITVLELSRLVSARVDTFLHDGPAGRRRLQHWALGLALLLTVLQTLAASLVMFAKWGIADEVLRWVPFFGLHPFAYSVFLALTRAAALVAMLVLAEVISEHGIGNGLIVLLFADYAHGFWSSAKRVVDPSSFAPTMPIFRFVAIIAAATAIIALVELAYRRFEVEFLPSGGEAERRKAPLDLPVGRPGVLPLIAAGFLFRLKILTSWREGSWTDPSHLDTVFYLAAYVAVVGVLAAILGAASAVRLDLAASLKRRGAYLPGVPPGPATGRVLAMPAIPVLVAVALAAASALPLLVNEVARDLGSRFIVMTALGIRLLEARSRRRESLGNAASGEDQALVTVSYEDSSGDAAVAKALLLAHGIPARIAHREVTALSPGVVGVVALGGLPIEVMPADADRARDLLEQDRTAEFAEGGPGNDRTAGEGSHQMAETTASWVSGGTT